MIDYRAARLNMVEGQLRTNKVTNESVLEAFLAVPRERFVPSALKGIAYVDDDVPLSGGRVLMEPMVQARLLQLAAITPRDSILEIGAATGYGTALLRRLAARVTAVECDSLLAANARATLAELGITDVRFVEGPLERGDPEGAPYDVIVIEGGVAAVPVALTRQLALGGRLVTVLRPSDGIGHGAIVTRVDSVVRERPVFDAGTPLLPGFRPAPAFVF